MKKWLMKKLGVYRKKNMAELEIIEKLLLLNLSDNDRDNVVDVITKVLDNHFD